MRMWILAAEPSSIVGWFGSETWGLVLTGLSLLIGLGGVWCDRSRGKLRADLRRYRRNKQFDHKDFVLNLELVNRGKSPTYVGQPKFYNRWKFAQQRHFFRTDAAGDFPNHDEAEVEAPQNKPIRATFTLDSFLLLRREADLDVSRMIIAVPFGRREIRTRLSKTDTQLLERLTNPETQKLWIAGSAMPAGEDLEPGDVVDVFFPVEPETELRPGFPPPRD